MATNSADIAKEVAIQGESDNRIDGAKEEIKRPQFGSRYLKDPSKVFEHNAWDNVQWDEEQEEVARKKVAENSELFIQEEQREKYESDADQYWNDFYTQHQNRFFKDRHWLFTEFPELAPEPNTVNSNDTEAGLSSVKDTHQRANAIAEVNLKEGKIKEDFPGSSASTRILEVGCGVGNTVFPILQTNNDPGLFVYCCDFSSTAIDLVKSHADYSTQRCHAFVCDIVDDAAVLPFPENSLDIIVLIFVLSAVHPDKMQSAIDRLCRHLKPGGLLLFRDYGRYDMAQLRFKKGRCLSDNFYVRGDGTRVYFFTQDELGTMFTSAGLVEEQNSIDRRLQVNRGRQLTMYRVWIQCKFRKPIKS
ncbi:tRNA N(3)-cytidine methyltransferase METTL2-like [Ptychodera flava]|uniref:tRNA N(3)-cytidine methyltransferase METTL2-like n=1 Tax=Ptychodera flava TaxID=63121 RepID=UPI003969C816